MPPVVAFIFTHRIQYFINVLDELDRSGRIKPVAIYARQTEAMKDAGFGRRISWDNRADVSYKEILLPDTGRSHNGFPGSFNRTLLPTLREIKPAAIHLNGFAAAIQWQGMQWARRWKIPILLRGDGDILSEKKVSASRLRGILARYFTSRASHVFFQGEENRKYWLARGAHPKKMSWLPCVSDTAVFHRVAFPDGTSREAFRQTHGARPSDLVLVVSGKLDQRKRPADALHLLSHLNRSRNPKDASPPRSIRIWFLGSGPLESELRSQAAELDVAEQVHFWGFRNQTDMPAILQAADVLLHLSEADPWPYSVLDAAASGLALLLSDHTGSCPDWQMPPTACEVFPCGDIPALAAKVTSLQSRPRDLRALQSGAKLRSRMYTEATFCSAFEAAISRLESGISASE